DEFGVEEDALFSRFRVHAQVTPAMPSPVAGSRWLLGLLPECPRSLLLRPFYRRDANPAHGLAQHRRLPERLGWQARAEVVHEHSDLGIAQTFDGHQDSLAVLADDREQTARLVRQIFSLLRQRA